MYQNPWMLERLAQDRQQQLRHEAEQMRMAKAARGAQSVETGPRGLRLAGSHIVRQAALALTALLMAIHS
jgi:hypothetical protein